MLAANNLRAILDAAEQAAAREDLASAEQLLRQALALQESTPGSPREEIARTLNNLAVVCEMTGKVKDAESCYRRAYANARASLPASDPFVTTSRDNLDAFCKAQGLPLASAPAPAPPPAESSPPLQRPAQPHVAAPERSGASSTAARRSSESEGQLDPKTSTPMRAQAAPAPPPPRPASPTPTPPRAASAVPTETTRASRGIVIGVLLLSAVAIGVFVARTWFAASEALEPVATISPAEPAAPVPAPAAVPPPAATPEPTREPEPAREPEPVASAPTPTPPAPEPSGKAVPSSAPTVVTAQLCRSLSTTGAWECESASGTQAPGTLYFYTRVAAAGDTVVEHRWYRDDRLHQRVQLRIRANQSGFRTFSRNTVGPDRAGSWKVELRSSDGQILHEEVFAVR